MKNNEYKIEESLLYKRNIKISNNLWKVYLSALCVSFLFIAVKSVIA